MTRIKQCAELIRAGRTPGQIQKQLGPPQDTISGYLDRAVGEGFITRSEILLNIVDEVTSAGLDPLDPDFTKLPRDDHEISRNVLIADFLYFRARDGANTLRSELLPTISSLEASLHYLVARVLSAHFNSSEDSWWDQGVPEPIRRACSRRREDDDDPAHPYAYTLFSNLYSIIEQRWDQFREHLPPAASGDKANLISTLRRINAIRNRLVHPTRTFMPGRADFELAISCRDGLAPGAWRFDGTPAQSLPA